MHTVEDEKKLEGILAGRYPGDLSQKLFSKYANAFESSYFDECSTELITQDIEYLEKITPENFLELEYYFTEPENQNQTRSAHLRLYKKDSFISLSTMLPILGHFGFQVSKDRTYPVKIGEESIWISDFEIFSEHPPIALEDLRNLLHRAFIALCKGVFISDRLNELILSIGLSWEEIVILRAYCRYILQTNFIYRQHSIEAALVNNAAITKNIIALFKALHDPQLGERRDQADLIEAAIITDLDLVSSLDDDLILRHMVALIKATMRTNYFQVDASGNRHPYLSFKFLSTAIPNLVLPVPLYEIFVYSSRFEGIHLRANKVARGGIRWSDRHDDFRYEILGLMKAQKVKNSVIVPTGAKGGFVLKALPKGAARDQIQKEGVECYQLFIRALLGLTDNIKEDKTVHPQQVVCRDGDDPYLVVAADKGTATFSDIANNISLEFGFWLGDAFASGGKTGYDHKKMGITARGAWESAKRHFIDLEFDFEAAPLTMVGIGDMSGDVFGNGLIYSKHLKLVAAFDHRHIFLDPDPNPEKSFYERLRLFNQPGSSWEDYSPTHISAGGGVYKRSAKLIPISEQVKKVLGIQSDSLMPHDLIRCILKAPVDLLWNGGIGTYIKASSESHIDVGDKSNDLIRINGNELRCKAVAEGGNLGLTQRGRAEYALNNGQINTDFIDNSAGVDCSDHEVNLKILLNREVAKGVLKEDERNQVLSMLTQDVADLVLMDNYNQAWILSYLKAYSVENSASYQKYMVELERRGYLNRKVEFLPDDKAMKERIAAGKGLTAPELAVLLANTKIYIKDELLKSDLLEEPLFAEMISETFPSIINERFLEGEKRHILHREIIATHLSNRVVNEMNLLFVYQLETERGASVADIVKAFIVASTIFKGREVTKGINAIGNKISTPVKREWHFYMRHLINISSRWFLQEKRLQGDTKQIIEHYSSSINKLSHLILELMTGMTKTFLDDLRKQFAELGLSTDLATEIAFVRVAYITLNIIEGATANQLDLGKMAKMYFAVGKQFNLVWFRDRLAQKKEATTWAELARLALRDELDYLQKTLTATLLKTNGTGADVEQTIEDWVTKNAKNLFGWKKMLANLQEDQASDYSMYFVALRKLGEAIKQSL